VKSCPANHLPLLAALSGAGFRTGMGNRWTMRGYALFGARSTS